MDRRKVSFEEATKISQNGNIIVIPTPKKHSNLVKPDFSPILEKQNQFGYKKFGSYKKPKFNEPESPMKSPNFKTSVKMQGRNLFGTKKENENNNFEFFKKLNFDDYADEKNCFLGKKNGGENLNFENKNEKNKFNMFLEKCEEEDEDNFNLGNNKKYDSTQNTGMEIEEEEEKEDKLNDFYNNDFFRYKKKGGFRKCSINIEKNIAIVKSGKFEEEFNQLKTIKTDKFSTIYKVQNIKTKEIYCVKKIVKTSPKSNIDNLKKITQDFKYNINNILSKFCVQIEDFWIEQEEIKEISDQVNFCNKNLYLLTNFYENGDIFDYLEKLEENKFIFTEDFYWDLVFEMIMGLLFVHECGYMHIDIQPGNYLVDADGYLKLNDFSLAIEVVELPYLDDIVDGDARYISKELFHFVKNSKINEKSDIYSLGLTILELIAKIDLPYNGELWHKLRDENFKISESFFKKSNIKSYKEFMILISQMILPFEKRPSLKEIVNYFPKLKSRYDSLLSGKYQKSYEVPKFCGDMNMKILNLKSAPSTDIL